MINYKTTRTNKYNERGLYIATVLGSSDFQVGDRIIGVNGNEVSSSVQMRDIISKCHVDEIVTITVMRDDEYIDVYVPLTEKDLAAASIPSSTPEYAA